MAGKGMTGSIDRLFIDRTSRDGIYPAASYPLDRLFNVFHHYLSTGSVRLSETERSNF